MTSKIVDHIGVKKISINGRIVEPLAFRSFRPEARNISDFYKAGIRLMSVLTTGQDCTLDVPYSPFGEIWNGIGDYDFGPLDDQMEMFIKNAPEAYFNIMLQIDTKEWYLRENPECSNTFYNLVEMAGYRKWRKDSSQFLRDTLAYIENRYGEVVFAYTLFCGGSTEWYTNSQGYGKPEALIRWHAVKERCFAEWLGDPEAKLPDNVSLYRTSNGIFRDPVADRQALDYWKFHNYIIGETILYFASEFQKVINHRKLLGLYYGYLHTLGGKRLLHEGNLGYEQVWASPDIDMIFSPAKYGAIRGFDGPSGYLTAVDSIGLNGKLSFQEIDHTTYIAPRVVENGRAIPGSEAKLPDSFQTRMVLRREFVLTRVKRTGMWWFDFFGGYYYAKDLMDEVASMISIQERLAEVPMESAAEIAVFGDTGSMFYPSIYSMMSDDLLVTPPEVLSQIGAPFDSYTLSDIVRSDFPHRRYKLYIFLNALELQPDYQKAIETYAQTGGKHLLWIYAPGYIAADGFSTSAMSEITGMNITESDGNDSKVIVPLVDKTYSFAKKLFPLFSVDDGDAEVLGTYTSNRRAALARKIFADYTSWYSAVGCLPAGLYRHIAKHSGVHIYYDGTDPIYVNSRLIGIHLHQQETHTVSLPPDFSGSFEELFDGGSFSCPRGNLEIPREDGVVKFFLANTPIVIPEG